MLTIRSEQQCFGGTIGFYAHQSTEIGAEMRFSVYQPPQAKAGPLPVLYYLAGLTCNEETFMIKAGALRLAAELGLILVAPDTSPRGLNIPGEDDAWDFGTGAGFYLDAAAEPWARNYRMYSYVVNELPSVVAANFPVKADHTGIFGHSMGGHGALTIALKNPDRYRSDRSTWAAWDSSLLMRAKPYPGDILVDQGMADQFLEGQLHPDALEAAAEASGQSLTLRRHAGYDHSYWFIQSFIADHLRWHAERLGAV
jgi:S-formylglutathione hydrolase